MNRPNLSSRLFAEPSMIEGISRLLDVGATLQEYNASKTEEEADFKALRNDWKVVGNDLRQSINSYEQEFAKSA